MPCDRAALAQALRKQRNDTRRLLRIMRATSPSPYGFTLRQVNDLARRTLRYEQPAYAHALRQETTR